MVLLPRRHERLLLATVDVAAVAVTSATVARHIVGDARRLRRLRHRMRELGGRLGLHAALRRRLPTLRGKLPQDVVGRIEFGFDVDLRVAAFGLEAPSREKSF